LNSIQFGKIKAESKVFSISAIFFFMGKKTSLFEASECRLTIQVVKGSSKHEIEEDCESNQCANTDPIPIALGMDCPKDQNCIP